MQKKKREDKEEGAERERKRQHEQIKTEAQERKIKRVLEYESMSILPNADLEEEVIENEEEVIEE